MTEVLGWIPARGGSTGIPQKNIAHVAGAPLIAWTIEASLACELVNRTVVSTDDDTIGFVAEEFGAEVIERPEHLATDDADPDDALAHTLLLLQKRDDYVPDIVLRLQPTSPLRTADHITAGVEYLLDGASAIITLVEPWRHPYLMVGANDEGFVYVDEELLCQPRQDYPKAYCISGLLYGAWLEYWREHRFYGPELVGIAIPREQSIDVDDEFDLWLADKLLNRQLQESPA